MASEPAPALTMEPLVSTPVMKRSTGDRPEVVMVRATPPKSTPPVIDGVVLRLSLTEVMLLPVPRNSEP